MGDHSSPNSEAGSWSGNSENRALTMQLLEKRHSTGDAEGGESAVPYFSEIVRHQILAAHDEFALAQQLEAGKYAAIQLAAQAPCCMRLGQQSHTIRLPSHVVTLRADARPTESTFG